MTTGFYIGDVVRIMFYFNDVLDDASDVKKQPILDHGDVNKMQSILVMC